MIAWYFLTGLLLHVTSYCQKPCTPSSIVKYHDSLTGSEAEMFYEKIVLDSKTGQNKQFKVNLTGRIQKGRTSTAILIFHINNEVLGPVWTGQSEVVFLFSDGSRERLLSEKIPLAPNGMVYIPLGGRNGNNILLKHMKKHVLTRISIAVVSENLEFSVPDIEAKKIMQGLICVS